MKLTLVCRESPGAVDAIREYTLLLAEALRASGHAVDVQMRRPGGGWTGAPGRPIRLRELVEGRDAVVLEYNPFAYGRRGFAPWLVAELARLRLTPDRPRIVLMVHEPFVPMIGWRWMLMGLWQRAQLAALRACADVVLASVEAWATRFDAWIPRRPTRHLPVGSNLPDGRAARGEERARLGVDEQALVVATLDTGGSSRVRALVDASLQALAASPHDVVVLALGAGAPSPAVPAGVPFEVPGRLDAEQLARWLAAGDVFLAPFVDGVSTRRGSLMAALQHGLAVVGTDGLLTDSIFRRAAGAIRLAPPDRADLFVAEVLQLAGDAEARETVGRAGRALYEARFDWPVIAVELVDAIRR